MSINTYSVILKPQYRERGRGSPAQEKAGTQGAQAPLEAQGGKHMNKRASGGAASWFLFVLKVGASGMESPHCTDQPAHWSRCLCRLCRGSFRELASVLAIAIGACATNIAAHIQCSAKLASPLVVCLNLSTRAVVMMQAFTKRISSLD